MNEVHVSGLMTFLILGAVATVFTRVAYWLKLHSRMIYGAGWGVPGAFALAGLVQFVSGVPFAELSAKWDSLQGWQRGVLGVIIFVFACGLIFGILAVVAIMFFA
jgi:hypothetical protein